MKGANKKQLGMGAAVVGVCAFAAFLLFQILYRTYSPSSLNVVFVGGIAIIMLGTAGSVSALLLPSRRIFGASWGIGLLSFLLFFGWQLDYIATLLLVFAGLFATHAIIQKEYRERIRLNPFWMLMRAIGLQMTILAFLFAMSYYVSPRFRIELPSIALPKNLVEKAIILFGDELRIPLTADDLPLKIEDLPEEKGNWILANLPNVSRNQSVAEAASGVLGVYINNWIRNTARINGADISPVLFVFGIFILVRTLSVPLAWIVVILSTVTVRVLTITHVIEIKKIQQEKEIIQL